MSKADNTEIPVTFDEEQSERIKNAYPMILTPIGGDPKLKYMMSMLATTITLFSNNLKSEFVFTHAMSDLAYARNFLAARFYHNKVCDQMIWIDSDIGWQTHDFLKLLASPHDVIGGAYRKKLPGKTKREDITYMDDSRGEPKRDPTGALTVDGLGLGFLKVSRRAFEKIVHNRPDLWADGKIRYDVPEELLPGPVYRLFQFAGDGHPEDYEFCRLWRSLGGDIWLDPSIVLAHMGDCEYFTDVREFTGG